MDNSQARRLSHQIPGEANTPALVVIESPYRGDSPGDVKENENVEYARRAMADSLARGEFPIASHLLYTQPGILDDSVPEQRNLGMTAGLVWGARAGQKVVFYCDRGISKGMYMAAIFYRRTGLPLEVRWLDDPSPEMFAKAAMLVGEEPL